MSKKPTPSSRTIGMDSLSPAAAEPVSDYSAFVSAVLEPLPDETLLDTEYNFIVRSSRRKVWRRAVATTRYFKVALEYGNAADNYSHVVEQNSIAGLLTNAHHTTLVKAYREAISRQILTPAPNIAAIAWKRAQRDGYLPINQQEIEAAIAADERFLAAHPTRRARAKDVA
jgi:hypothetical protein